MNDTEQAGGLSQTLLGMIAAAVVIAVLVIAFLARGYYANDMAQAPDAPQPDTETVAAAAPKTVTSDPDPEPVAQDETPATAPEPQPVVVTDPDASPEAQDDASPTGQAATEPLAPVKPALDLVRVDPDGSTLIAGKADPGSQVTVLLDGAELHRTTADASGSFVAFVTLPPSEDPRVISLSSQGSRGAVVASADQIIVAPLAALVVPADKAPEGDTVVAELPAPEPVDETVAAEQSGAAEQVAEIAAAETQDAPDVAAADTAAAETQSNTAVAVLKADDTGVELLQTGQAPQVMSNVALDTISYSGAGEVQLSGRAPQGDGFVRVYLNNASIATLPVDDRGRWRGDLPNVDSGVYTLRIDQVDSAGVVTSRVETPFKREAPEVLAAALADQPSAGPVQAVTVQKGATLWAIARETYGDGMLFVRVFEANRDAIKNPDLIYPGQVFALP